jgi:hypothetical protein
LHVLLVCSPYSEAITAGDAPRRFSPGTMTMSWAALAARAAGESSCDAQAVKLRRRRPAAVATAASAREGAASTQPATPGAEDRRRQPTAYSSGALWACQQQYCGASREAGAAAGIVHQHASAT